VDAKQKSKISSFLFTTPEHVELRLPGDAGRPFFVDLSKVDVASSAGRSLKQPIAKALGIKKRSDPAPVVIDATAGWGEDTWLILSFGCRVLAVERDEVVAALLRDGLRRAGVLDSRVQVLAMDAKNLLRQIAEQDFSDDLSEFCRPDVVYLDPMYPGHERRKTAERKPMKILRELVGDDTDADGLLHRAKQVALKRVVVKRPLRATLLAQKEPDVVYKGKSLRYDVYFTRSRA